MPVASTPNDSSANDVRARVEPESTRIFDARPQIELLDSQLRQAIDRVMRSGAYILGDEVGNFEGLCSRQLRVAHAVGTSSGSDALFLALLALGIGPGDEVITSAFSFVATAEAILRTGATPVFADIDPESFCLCPLSTERMVTERTRAILFVHLYGNTGDIVQLAEFCVRRGIRLVEDACQAYGASVEGRAAGTWGSIGCFSFFPTKPLGGMGDGGMCVTDDAAIAQQIRSLRVHGPTTSGTVVRVSGNFRLDALQAAILAAKAPEVERFRLARQAIATRYTEELRDCPGLVLPDVAVDTMRRAWSLYTVRALVNRNALIAHLARDGIESKAYYATPLSDHPAIAPHCRSDALPQTEAAARQVFSIPMYYGLSIDAQQRVITSIRKWLFQ